MASGHVLQRLLLWVGLFVASVALSPSGFVLRRPALARGGPFSIPAGRPQLLAAAAAPRRHLARRRASALNELLEPGPGESVNGPRFAFVGGKGGVGKTSTAAALAVQLADAGLRVLVVSTDPAHSLGDALALGNALRDAAGAPVRVEGPGEATGGSLDALEVDAEAAMADLGSALAAFDITEAAREVGGQAAADFVDKLGLKDFAKLLETPPPGIDEIVALSDVLRFAKGTGPGGVAYDRVLIDTAPTGHTLRLLSAPDFLDALLGKLTGLRARLGGALGMGASLFGLDVASLNAKLDAATATLEGYRTGVAELRALFRSGTQTQFIAVASPTPLAVAETRRLVEALADQGVAVNHLVVNKVLAGGAGAGDGAAAAAADGAVMATMRRGQAAALARATAPGSPLASVPGLTITQVPLFDADISGVPGLRYMAAVAFAGKYEVADLREPLEKVDAAPARADEAAARADKWAALTAPADDPRSSASAQRFVVVGGKGGVGKTSTAAALAVACCETGGYNTVVVSTDPAHSLGDALGLALPRGALVPVTNVDSSGSYGGAPGGCLYALEVDTAGAVAEFKELVQSFAASASSGEKGGGLLGGLNLGDFADVLDTAPPGLDELVALSKVLQLVQQQGSESGGNGGAATTLGGAGVRFDRIVIDTAPTGHTLRLLSLPKFLDDFLEKLIALRKKVQGASSFLGNLGLGGGSGGSSVEAGAARDRLREFQVRMYALEDLLTDPAIAEFVVVAVPTELAVAESERLVAALADETIAVNHLVLNQVLRPAPGGAAPSTGPSYVDRLRAGQGACVAELQAVASQAPGQAPLAVTQVPWLDTEARGVYGLRALGQALLR